ncbi:unnamed protein product [Soboliphyme baturini]|uniref:Uncharacterized protein n=1 Tax=Soboliphyme baturini TaxID=241478 RepID=A0A183J2F6_9BILA|nr:unnamed protein product [Soboliphyme baturini]
MVLGVLATKVLKNHDERKRNTVIRCTEISMKFEQYKACLRPLFVKEANDDMSLSSATGTQRKRMLQQANQGGKILVSW